MDETDIQIIDRVLAGETDAFADIVARYQRQLYNLALRMGQIGDAASYLPNLQIAYWKRVRS